MASLVLIILFTLAMIGGHNGILAVEYTVTNSVPNTVGGARFERDIGAAYTQQTMDAATSFIWTTFQQTDSPADRKDTQAVSLFVEEDAGLPGAVASTRGNQIQVSARYIEEYSGDVNREFTGVVYHEMVHVWQWSGPGGLIEGIADYVRLKAGYAPSHWVGPGEGDRWDQGYAVTARFLDYCDGLRSGFVAELNKRMRNGYSDDYFVDLLGKKVDQLWADYRAAYGTA